MSRFDLGRLLLLLLLLSTFAAAVGHLQGSATFDERHSDDNEFARLPTQLGQLISAPSAGQLKRKRLFIIISLEGDACDADDQRQLIVLEAGK